MTMAVSSYVAGRWQDPAGDRVALLDATTSRPVAEIGTAPIDMVPVIDHARSVGGPALREMTFHERALAAQTAGPHSERPARRVLRAVHLDRRDPAGLARRRRRRHRGAVHLRQQGPPGTAQHHRAGRRTAEKLGRKAFRRPAHLHAATGDRPADQRLQLPGLGDAGEARSGVPGRGAHRRQARLPDVLPGAGRGRRDHRVRAASRGQPAAGGRRLPRAARPRSTSRTPSPSPDPRPPPRACEPTRRVLTGGVRFSSEADSLNFSVLGADVRPGQRRIRPVRAATGHRDDRQGRPEVHRDPPCPGPRADGGAGHRRGPGPHRRQGAGRQPGGQRTSPWARWSGLAQRDEVRRNLEARCRRGPDRRRRPGPVRPGGRRPAARRVPAADPAARARTPAAASRTTSRCSARSAP